MIQHAGGEAAEAANHVDLQGCDRSAVWDGRDDGAPMVHADERAMQPGGGVPPVW